MLLLFFDDAFLMPISPPMAYRHTRPVLGCQAKNAMPFTASCKGRQAATAARAIRPPSRLEPSFFTLARFDIYSWPYFGYSTAVIRWPFTHKAPLLQSHGFLFQAMSRHSSCMNTTNTPLGRAGYYRLNVPA